jgi:hypothetical protein
MRFIMIDVIVCYVYLLTLEKKNTFGLKEEETANH